MDSFLESCAPARGYILAFYPDALIFEPYVMKDGEPYFEGSEALRGEIPWECHLFDEEREFRRVYRESAGGLDRSAFHPGGGARDGFRPVV